MFSIHKTFTNFLRNVILRRDSKRRFTVCVEGNIGSGKTTFLNNFKIYNNTAVLQEPVQLWRNVAGENLLELMYKDTERYACLFQSYVQLTMVQLHKLNTSQPYKIMERSAYSARLFIENMKRNKTLKDVELYVLEAWYNWSIENSEIETDLIVYLRTSPEVVYKRMRERARKEEDCVSLDYLQQLHKIHDEWLLERKIFSLPAPVIVLNGDKNLEEMISEFNICKENIYNKQISYKPTENLKSQRIKEAT
ncbi:deoxynucleoside kinase [Leptopilina boulardi]|uniref:deoxynucleoside kinase n=1 Tax=Leptopilina boulardi TaxID=63433 RepID=UPI0021F5B6FC|nr:deoxynucleoside kinase [Leptopilina boulardi]XP_051166708.1 deoxynucleoside kinase [Leptopilina boulardi]XP_051166709.1 deoxynucleoside kinase [Leptopilina boulardi]